MTDVERKSLPRIFLVIVLLESGASFLDMHNSCQSIRMEQHRSFRFHWYIKRQSH